MPTPARHLADLQIVGISIDAVHRRANLGPRQVEPRLVDGGLRLGDLRLLAGATAALAFAARARASERSVSAVRTSLSASS
jgi:hypothetical protein